ncbi:MAG: SRPBCC family protein [Pseudomonadales bacterium]|nr:SRPBCC family protein [Pseudomonadales bacterium]
MIKVAKTVLINASDKDLWNIIADVGGIHNFHPLVDKSPLLSTNAQGLGATRRCEFYDGTSVVEEVVEWEEGKKLSLALSKFSMPFESAVGTMSVESAGNNASHVTLQMDFKVKYGFIGKIMGLIMMKPFMKMVFAKVLKGLNDHATTGLLVGKKGALLQKY